MKNQKILIEVPRLFHPRSLMHMAVLPSALIVFSLNGGER